MTRKHPFHRLRRRGFTLIELLIVIAIVLILIAIALPNFLEAQIRAKTTKAKGELRTMAIAMEAYNLDWRDYPPSPGKPTPHGFGLFRFSLICLTTPIQYLLNGIPQDPFAPPPGTQEFLVAFPGSTPQAALMSLYNFDPVHGNGYFYWAQDFSPPVAKRMTAAGINYVLGSLGPGRIFYHTWSGWEDWAFDNGLCGTYSSANSDFCGPIFYGPTNGTNSGGVIVTNALGVGN